VTARPSSNPLVPVVIGLTAALAGWTWYLQPDRTRSSVAILLMLGVMVIAGRGASWLSQREPSRRDIREPIASATLFAASMIGVVLAIDLAILFGLLGDADLSRRASQIILGAFFVFTGNAMPKTLTPLATLKCNGARVQSFQRFAGWTWVLTGLSYSIAWIVFPIELADPVSLTLLIGGMVAIVTRMILLRRRRHTAA